MCFDEEATFASSIEFPENVQSNDDRAGEVCFEESFGIGWRTNGLKRRGNGLVKGFLLQGFLLCDCVSW